MQFSGWMLSLMVMECPIHSHPDSFSLVNTLTIANMPISRLGHTFRLTRTTRMGWNLALVVPSTWAPLAMNKVATISCHLLATGCQLLCNQWDELPMPRDYITCISNLGWKQGMPKSLTFADWFSHEIMDEPDTVEDDHDSDYDPNNNLDQSTVSTDSSASSTSSDSDNDDERRQWQCSC
jgi:hypothetical protein